MKFIYVASPYSHEDKGIMTRRSHQALEFVARYYNDNPNPECFLYSPIAYMAQAERDYGLPSDFQFWQKIDEAAIKRFDEMWVLMFDGVEHSSGVRSEVAYAQSLDIVTPVRLVFEDGVTSTLLTKELAEQYNWKWLSRVKVRDVA